jgi:hypothetical protein
LDPSFDAIYHAVLAAGLRRERPLQLNLALTSVCFSGRLRSGRRAAVSFARRGGETLVRLTVLADDSPRFEVTREALTAWLAKLVGWSRGGALGNAGFDRPLHIETSEPERVSAALEGGLRGVTQAIFGHGTRRLALEEGVLAAEIPYFELEPARYALVLGLLDQAATTFDRTPIRVRILGGDRRALSAGGRTRCAYCHGGLSGDEDGLVACECCATVLHESCWGEHGRCPILGCEGKEPERSKSSGGG